MSGLPKELEREFVREGNLDILVPRDREGLTNLKLLKSTKGIYQTWKTIYYRSMERE